MNSHVEECRRSLIVCFILGMRTVSSLNADKIILATIKFSCNFTIKRVPLHRRVGSKFLIIITGDPFFNSNLWGGSPDSSKESRNYMGKWVAFVPSYTELKEKYCLIFPENRLMQVTLMFLTHSLIGTKTHFEKTSRGLSNEGYI